MSCGQTNQSSYRILNCDQRHGKPLLEGEATRPIILCIRCVSAEMDKGNDSVDYPNSVCQNGK
ncbi:hypothetical protein BLOT_003863 [Blomia tropicalis]|nr:hypothetical protein BLOT_003863 [Blomia tropicalis]